MRCSSAIWATATAVSARRTVCSPGPRTRTAWIRRAVKAARAASSPSRPGGAWWPASASAVSRSDAATAASSAVGASGSGAEPRPASRGRQLLERLDPAVQGAQRGGEVGEPAIGGAGPRRALVDRHAAQAQPVGRPGRRLRRARRELLAAGRAAPRGARRSRGRRPRSARRTGAATRAASRNRSARASSPVPDDEPGEAQRQLVGLERRERRQDVEQVQARRRRPRRAGRPGPAGPPPPRPRAPRPSPPTCRPRAATRGSTSTSPARQQARSCGCAASGCRVISENTPKPSTPNAAYTAIVG